MPDASGVTLVDALGWAASVLYFLIALMPTKRGVSLCSLLTNLVYTCHFALLGASSGMANQLFGAVNAYLAFCEHRPRLHKHLWVALIPIGFWFSTSVEDLLPHASMLLWLVALQCEELLALRLLGALSCVPWIFYAAHVGSRSTLAACALSGCLQLLQARRAVVRRRSGGAGVEAGQQKKGEAHAPTLTTTSPRCVVCAPSELVGHSQHGGERRRCLRYSTPWLPVDAGSRRTCRCAACAAATAPVIEV